MNADKQEALQNARERYICDSRLSLTEIDELLNFEFISGPVTIEEQLRRYYLLIKRDGLKTFDKMWKDVKPFIKKGVINDQDVHDLSVVLNKYISGFCINLPLTKEMKAEMAKEYPLPLTLCTSQAPKPYKIWRGGSETVQFKVWRIGRPTVCGYGVTLDEAVEDLRYRVQPDHTGELDGLGRPDGVIIGGNMFDSKMVTQHNKGRFAKA